MSTWLVKTEPDEYSFDDLLREKTTVWSGVSNAVAQKHLRSMKKGDDIFVYHTGSEKAIVGLARVASGPYPDPADATSRYSVARFEGIRRLERRVTLSEMRIESQFSLFELLHNSRLSVLPVPPHIHQLIINREKTA